MTQVQAGSRSQAPAGRPGAAGPGQAYLYGVGRADCLGTSLRAQGMPDGRAPISTITVGGAAAIIGGYPGPPMRDLPQREVLDRLAIHQAVIEDAMRRGDVLPARFGTVFTSPDEIRLFLARWGGVARQALDQFAGLVEVEAAATWDLGRTLAEIAQAPEVTAAKEEALQAPPELRRQAQVKAGRIVKEVLDARRDDCQDKLLRRTRPLAVDVQPNPLLADELVFNVAFLLQRDALPAFDAALDRLDTELQGALSIRRVGPLPPYSFATLEVTRFDAERLAVGRALLGLAGEICEEAVLAGYRRLAPQVHPDRNPADGSAAERFAALRAARDDLLAYCRNRGQDKDPAFLVTIGRAGNGTAPGRSPA
jgi:hypothetical protein